MVNTMNYVKIIAEKTRTEATNWIAIDGPSTGMGLELWFRNDVTGSEAYVCNHAGDVAITVDDDLIYAGQEPSSP